MSGTNQRRCGTSQRVWWLWWEMYGTKTWKGYLARKYFWFANYFKIITYSHNSPILGNVCPKDTNIQYMYCMTSGCVLDLWASAGLTAVPLVPLASMLRYSADLHPHVLLHPCWASLALAEVNQQEGGSSRRQKHDWWREREYGRDVGGLGRRPYGRFPSAF